MSINDWHKAGILRREIALYKRISSQEVSFSFITYGNKEDLKFQDQLGNIKILCNYFNLPKYFYELALNISLAFLFQLRHYVQTKLMVPKQLYQHQNSGINH